MIASTSVPMRFMEKQTVDGCRVELYSTNQPKVYRLRLVDDIRPLWEWRLKKPDRECLVFIDDNVPSRPEDWDLYCQGISQDVKQYLLN